MADRDGAAARCLHALAGITSITDLLSTAFSLRWVLQVVPPKAAPWRAQD
jgi:hypothetical protein